MQVTSAVRMRVHAGMYLHHRLRFRHNWYDLCTFVIHFANNDLIPHFDLLTSFGNTTLPYHLSGKQHVN